MPECYLEARGDRLRGFARRILFARGTFEDLGPAALAVLRKHNPVRVGERGLAAPIGDSDPVHVREPGERLVEMPGELAWGPGSRVHDWGEEARIVGADEVLWLLFGDPRERRVGIDARARRIDDLERLRQCPDEVDRLGDRLLRLAGEAEDEAEVGRDAVLAEQSDERVQVPAPERLLSGLQQRIGRAVDRDRDMAVRLAHEVRCLARPGLRMPCKTVTRCRSSGRSNASSAKKIDTLLTPRGRAPCTV